jgi:hypothetical protein
MKRLARNVAQAWEFAGLLYVSWRYAREDNRARALRQQRRRNG